MLGVVVNIFAIIAGSLLGLMFKQHIPKGKDELFFNIIGLFTLSFGVIMIQSQKDPVVVVISLLLGTLLGEFLNIEGKLNFFAEKIKSKFSSDSSSFVDGFVLSSVTFCVGPMAVLGSILDGMGDPSVLITKSILDGFMSITFASSLGIGVAFSTIPVFVYQAAIAAFATFLKPVLAGRVIDNFTSTGGVLLVGLGLSLLGLKKIKVANMLPSLLFVVLLSYSLAS